MRLRPHLLIVLALLGALLLPATVAPPAHAMPTVIRRVAGADRYETAVAVSQTLLPNGGPVDFVLVATGENWPDGIFGGLTASRLGTSVLLVRTTSVPDSTAVELIRLAPRRIVILGGPAAVNDAVAQALAAYADEVLRVGGIDRYETAALLMRAFFPPGRPEAFVASGTDFRTALLAAAEGAFYGNGPAFLVPPDGVLPATVAAALDELGPFSAVYVTGGTNLVSGAMADQLAPHAGTVLRDTGADVYEISVRAWAGVIENGAPAAILATSAAFPDGLVGASIAGAGRWPLFLSEPQCIPGVVLDALDRMGADGLLLLGGTAALSPAIEALTRCGSTPPPATDCPFVTIAEVEAAVGRDLQLVSVTPWRAGDAAFLGPHQEAACLYETVPASGGDGTFLQIRRFAALSDALTHVLVLRSGDIPWDAVTAVTEVGDEGFTGLFRGMSLFVVRSGATVVEFYDEGPHTDVIATSLAQHPLMRAVLTRL